MDDDLEANRRAWDERAAHHPDTDHYDVRGFLDGASSLHALEREEFGPVLEAADSLLHLQCHFGLDTLSWARDYDVEAVGVDFSPEAISRARALAEDAGLDDRATFVEADVQTLALDTQFDAVFTSYGVLTWLPDLDAWADTIAGHLRPGGTFYIAEIHPFIWPFEAVSEGVGRIAYPYFDQPDPLVFDEDGSYADFDAEFEHTEMREWPHAMGTIVTALADAGLRIDYLHEESWLEFQLFPTMVQDAAGRWHLPDDGTPELPLTFSLQATKTE